MAGRDEAESTESGSTSAGDWNYCSLNPRAHDKLHSDGSNLIELIKVGANFPQRLIDVS